VHKDFLKGVGHKFKPKNIFPGKTLHAETALTSELLSTNKEGLVSQKKRILIISLVETPNVSHSNFIFH
jgi:hypothetical protein